MKRCVQRIKELICRVQDKCIKHHQKSDPNMFQHGETMIFQFTPVSWRLVMRILSVTFLRKTWSRSWLQAQRNCVGHKRTWPRLEVAGLVDCFLLLLLLYVVLCQVSWYVGAFWWNHWLILMFHGFIMVYILLQRLQCFFFCLDFKTLACGCFFLEHTLFSGDRRFVCGTTQCLADFSPIQRTQHQRISAGRLLATLAALATFIYPPQSAGCPEESSQRRTADAFEARTREGWWVWGRMVVLACWLWEQGTRTKSSLA